MAKKVRKTAKLVLVSLMTRVVVDETATEKDILDATRSAFIEKVRSELGEHIEEIYDDTECPYGSLPGDIKLEEIKDIFEMLDLD